MAKVVLAKGNKGPVNQGELSVLKLLESNLPDEFEIHPNLEVSLGHGQLAECDAIIIGPDCVWLIEVKDIFGDVDIGEHEFTVNDEIRQHPVHQTRKKAQQMKSRVSNDPNLKAIWIQPLVIFARTPKRLSVSPQMRTFVSIAESAIEILLDPTKIQLQRNRLSADLRDRFKTQLNLNASSRRFRQVYGSYRCLELRSEGGNSLWWNAEHTLLGNRVVLEVVHVSPLLRPEEQEEVRNRAVREAKVRGRVGASVFLLLPETAFIADDGSVVVVHATDHAGTLNEAGDEVRAWDDNRKRGVVWSIANAVDRLHSNGITHRRIGPGNIYVLRNGAAKLGGLSTAGFEGRPNRTFGPADWGSLGGEFFISPEHSRNEVTGKSDIYALGLLIRHLWPDAVPPELQDITRIATNEEQELRTVTAREIAEKSDIRTQGVKQPPKADPSPPNLESGLILDERYRLVDCIGRGASSEVWHAEDLQTQDSVALKFLLSTDAGEMAKREFMALKDRIHPGIVRVIDFRFMEHRWVLLSEYLDGPNLRLVMPPAAPTPSKEQAVSAILEILSALKAIHPNMRRIIELVNLDPRSETEELELNGLRTTGITHRDIKPENIILLDGRTPVLVDFGIAASGSDGEETGTVEYRPAGVALNSTDPDIDLFAVGIILHEMLTGRHPYLDSNPASRTLMIDQGLDNALERVLQKACAVRFADRFHSADDFIEALISLELESVPLPDPPVDLKKKMNKIRKALVGGKWAEALEQCPPEWQYLRDRILQRKGLAERAAESLPLVAHEGFELRYVKTDNFESAQSADTDTVGPGIIRIYRLSGPVGEVLDVGYFISDCGRRWVATVDFYETPLPLKRLGQGLRLGIREHGEQLVADLAQAQIKNDELWSNCYKADRSQLDSGAGVDTEVLFETHGATNYGTKEEILGDTSKRKNYLCAKFPQSAVDLPAVLYLVTRILPLARGICVQ